MKILILSTSFPGEDDSEIGGKFVYYDALALSQNGADVTVLTPHYKGALKIKHINSKLRVVRFCYFLPHKYQVLVDNKNPIYGSRSISKFLNIPFFLISFIYNTFKFGRHTDIIHCNWTLTVLIALPAKILFRKPIVLTARGSDLRLVPVWLNKWIYRKVDAAINCYGPQPWNRMQKQTFPSNYIKLPLISERYVGSDLPDDISSLKSYQESELKVLFLGRIDSVKVDLYQLPVFEIIRAAVKLYHQKIKIFICFIGGGDQVIIDKMQRIIQKNGMSDYIKLIGFRKDPVKYFRLFDVGIGGIAFNTVAQEFAMNSCLQILVNTNDNQNTPWENNKNCYLVQPGSEVCIAEVLLLISEQKDKTNEIQQNAHKMMSQFVMTPTEGGKYYIKAFKRLIKRN